VGRTLLAQYRLRPLRPDRHIAARPHDAEPLAASHDPEARQPADEREHLHGCHAAWYGTGYVPAEYQHLCEPSTTVQFLLKGAVLHLHWLLGWLSLGRAGIPVLLHAGPLARWRHDV
jgi:hypothetical protein